ncbi:hypothetical protein [Psychrobacter faecalis]|uniref:hypothetical protein n=1 Tax=Psychrobacter faecalis TaxID=180588 RepID=UPI001867B964|nr:hypothetical protein [Psychrobacter faecalis]
MDKRLLEQVQQAMQAQQDTIKRQEQMLDDKDRDIAELTASLNKLVQTRTQEMQRLPMLFNTLKESMEKYTREWVIWKNHRKDYVETQESITEQLLALANTQNRLAETLKEYQSMITPPDYLERDTMQLESKLNILASTQSEITGSQAKIIALQEKLTVESRILDELLSKPEL